MATLLLRLAGPMQSWGNESKFETRRTSAFPTKSGVIGMLASALGMSREESPARLCALRFGIRADREGELLRDYHIAKGEKPYITTRYYLSDAVFVVGFESDDVEFLKELEAALKKPAFPLFLGRRSCPPTMPLVLGIRDFGLLNALRDEPWQLEEWRRKKEDGRLRIVTDADSGNGEAIERDVPISFSRLHRRFGWRNVTDHGYISKKDDMNGNGEHDPFKELG